MNDLLVIMSSSSIQKLQPLYLAQLETAGIAYHVEPFTNCPNENGGGTLGYKIEIMRRLVQRFSDYGKIVFTCAWDVLFFGSKEDVLRKIPNDSVLLGAERNCYPDGSLAHRCKGDTPWRFVNGGLLAGTPERFLVWLEGIETHPHCHLHDIDQRTFNLLRAEDSPLVPVDARTELFYCVYMEQGELGFERGLPVNTLCGTHPQFLHFNGRQPFEPTLELYKRSLGI